MGSSSDPERLSRKELEAKTYKEIPSCYSERIAIQGEETRASKRLEYGQTGAGETIGP